MKYLRLRSKKKSVTWSALNFKNTWPLWVLFLSPRYGHVILVSGFLVLTAVNWLWNGSPIWQLTKGNMQPRSIIWLGQQASNGRNVARLRTYAHAMRPWANAANQDDLEKKEYAWVPISMKRCNVDHVTSVWQRNILVANKNRTVDYPNTNRRALYTLRYGENHVE